MSKKKKLLIYGGSFNPIHNQHIFILQHVLEQYKFDDVMIVPDGLSPHKKDQKTYLYDRLDMINLVLKDNYFPENYVMVLEYPTYEATRGRVVYIIDTIKYLQGAFPDYDLTLLIGADCLPQLHTWKDWPEIKKQCEFLAVSRNSNDIEQYYGMNPNILRTEYYDIECENIKMPFENTLSSTYIRERVGKGLSIKTMVPDCVDAFVKDKGLYVV